MAKERTGYCFIDKDGRWYARMTLTDDQGTRRNIKRRAKDEKDANRILKALAREIEDKGGKGLDGSRMTFDNLASYFEQRYVKPAEYVDGRKVAGLRSAVKAQSFIKTLRAYLGDTRLLSITYGEIERYKSIRLKTPTRLKGQRGIASVNRELAMLRRMLNIAVRQGWSQKNPFSVGDPLISPADERQRERILTREEEAQLLTTCTGRRVHLRPIIIAAIDTGCRKGELLKLRWSDVDFAEGLITIVAFNTKTLRARQVSMTVRLSNELRLLWEASGHDSGALVFGIVGDVKRSFTWARTKAGLDDLRFHDLRHTHGSRLDELGFSLAKIGAQLGHTVMQTTLRYVNRDRAGIKQIATALDSFNTTPPQTTEESQFIN